MSINVDGHLVEVLRLQAGDKLVVRIDRVLSLHEIELVRDRVRELTGWADVLVIGREIEIQVLRKGEQ